MAAADGGDSEDDGAFPTKGEVKAMPGKPYAGAAAPPEPPSTAAGVGGDDTGQEYAAYVKDLVQGQEQRKVSLEQRGVAVVTTSGTLVTLLFAVVALLTHDSGYALPEDSVPLLAASLTLFAAAAMLGLATNWPRRYVNVDFSDPTVLLGSWADAAATARRRVTATRLRELVQAQKVNTQKARVLAAAMAAQSVAVVLLAAALGHVLASA